MRLSHRLAKLEHATRGRGPAAAFTSLLALPVSAAGGRPPGVYPAGPGSTAGTLVYDPADGELVVPDGALARWGVLIVCPPKDPPP
jgi:hypothetical protein